MRVFIVTKEPFPYGMATTNRIKCYAKAIVSQGVPCEVLIFSRTETVGNIKNHCAKGEFETVCFRYVGGKSVRTKSQLVNKGLAVLDRLFLIAYLRRYVKSGDVVLSFVSSDVAYINHIAKVVHACDGKFVRELCELPAGTIALSEHADRKRRFIYDTQFPLCDGFIAISEALVGIATRYKSADAKIIRIPILVDYVQYAMPDKSEESDVPYIFHSGTLSEQKDGFIRMVKAFALALNKIDKPLRFVTTGNMKQLQEKDALLKLMTEYHLEDKILFTGYLDDCQLKKYLSQAKMTVINKLDTLQNRYCFSTKLAEYLAASKPVIITNVGEAMNWLENGVSAIIVPQGDTDALSDAIVSLANDDLLCSRIGSNGNEVCRTCFDYNKYGEKLIVFFRSL